AAWFRCPAPAGSTGGVGAAVMMGLPSLHTLDQAQGVRIWLATEKTDMRCGFDRLAERVKTVLGEDPQSGHLFVFRSRRGDRLKILLWDGDGFVLWYKRLEAECSNCHGWKRGGGRWSCGPASWPWCWMELI